MPAILHILCMHNVALWLIDYGNRSIHYLR